MTRSTVSTASFDGLRHPTNYQIRSGCLICNRTRVSRASCGGLRSLDGPVMQMYSLVRELGLEIEKACRPTVVRWKDGNVGRLKEAVGQS